ASGDLSYLAPYYERLLAMQDAGSTETFSTVDSQSLSYQAQFGTQKAAMMPMGTWYIGTLLAQRESGDADEFEWGMALAPQQSAAPARSPTATRPRWRSTPSSRARSSRSPRASWTTSSPRSARRPSPGSASPRRTSPTRWSTPSSPSAACPTT